METDRMTKETAVALMIAAGFQNDSSHPDSLEYTDNGYTVPESITPETGETFDSITETWNGGARTVTWGVGIIGKGTDNETVNRLIYPDETYISLINFNGVSGLG